MIRLRQGLFFSLALVLLACNKESNPALPTNPGPNPQQVSITLTSDLGQLNAGTASGTMLHVSARHLDGTLPADGTEVTLNTSLGNFGVDASGAPVKLKKATLIGGKADVQFFPGTETGTANILAQIGTATQSLNIPIVQPPPVPIAEFSFTAAGLSVIFTNETAGNATRYRWSFGDGTESAETNPRKTYSSPGTYTVTLTAGNITGETTKSKFVALTLGTPPTANFDFEIAGNQVNFVDRSTNNPTSWSWNFGDGTFSQQRNPIHIYQAPGAYTVTLTATNAAGSNSTSKIVTITAGEPPKAAFDFVVSGQQVNFIDKSSGNPTTWQWDFGDNTSSTQRNPVKVYSAPGTYTVVLTVSNAAGIDVTSSAVKIEAAAPPVADFAFSANGNTVNFVDKSTGGPTMWSWNFGDGTTSNQQNPLHTYGGPGNYTVTLTVSNGAGTNSTSKIVTIAAGTPPVANFEFTVSGQQVNFVDRSTGNPFNWFWNFGDGATSGFRNPIHTYGDPGTYTVTLTVSNSSGSDSISKVVTVPPPSP